MKLLNNSILLILVSCLYSASGSSSILEGVERTFDPSYLYDQSSISSEPEFQTLSAETQNQKVVGEFLSRKKSLLWGRCKQALTNAAGINAVKLTGAGITGRYGANVADPITKISIVGVAVGKAIEYVGNIFETSWQCINEIYINRKPDPMEELEIAYVKKKREIKDPVLIATIERKLTNDCRNDYTKAPCDMFVKTTLGLPTRNQKISYDKNLIAETFKYYPQNVTNAMSNFCLGHVISQPGEFSARPGKKIIAYFEGPPGAGKTEAAKLVAKALKLPYSIVSFAEASGTQKGIEKLTGTREGWGHGEPGLIAEAIVGSKPGESVKNKVLILDDADRIFNAKRDEKAGENPFTSYMRFLSDPETKSIDHPYFGTKIDISNLIIIVTGNTPIEDEALRKRFSPYYFHGYEKDQKYNLVMDVFVAGYVDNMNPDYKRYALMSDEDKKVIRAMVDNDADPGVRTILNQIPMYIESKVRRALETEMHVEIPAQPQQGL